METDSRYGRENCQIGESGFNSRNCETAFPSPLLTFTYSYIKPQCVCVFIRVLWRNRTNKKILIQIEKHDEKLAHRFMEAEKSPNMCNQSAGDPGKLTV